MSDCVHHCICVCKDVVRSLDSADNGCPYGLMSGPLAHIYVVCVPRCYQADFHIQTGDKMKKYLAESRLNTHRRFFTYILDEGIFFGAMAFPPVGHKRRHTLAQIYIVGKNIF